METMETVDIQDVEIFKEGFWNGKEYTESDIDLLVESFNEIGHLTKPYLKLGHDESQNLLQADGYPSAGWIDEVKKVGGTLVATFKDVPKKIGELIKKKAYKRISMEMFKNLKVENKTYPMVLRGAALLGGDTPAVLSLNDMVALYENNNYEEIIICTDYNKSEDVMADMADITKIDVDLKDLDEVKDTIEKFTSDLEEMKTKLGESEKEKAELASQLEAVEFSKKENEVNAYLESQVENKKILPNQVDMFKKLLLGKEEDGLVIFGKEDPKSQLDIVKEIIDSNESVDFTETSEQGELRKDKDDDLAERAIKFMKENKVEYAEALIEVSKEK